MSHTPGPWTVVEKSTGHNFEKNWREIGPRVVTASFYDRHRNGETETFCGVVITEANARLIAAAPEMLEALEEAIPVLTDAIEDSYCGMHRGRGLCDCKSDIVARISTIIARTKETPNA